jgi:hypothetical protein
VTNYELIVELELQNSSGIHTPARLDGTVLRSAFGAQPPENEFAFADDPLAEGARGRLGHVVPLNVLNISAAVANEVMMQQAFGIESRGAALDCHFTHQARLHQVAQIVIGRGPGRARIHAIHGFEDFDSRGMPVVFHQEGHHSVTLRGAAQPAAFQ